MTSENGNIGPYILGPLIAKGGMAEVFRARSRFAPEKIVAIKLMRPHLAAEKRYVEMFEREAKLVSLLKHEDIVPAIDAGSHEGQPYIVMEFVGGRDLSQVIKRAQDLQVRFTVPIAIYIASRMSRGLHYAHTLCDEAGRPLQIVNRDVSPSNTRIAFDGAVKLIDFGIAQALMKYTSEIGMLKGKVSYMSPEQVRGLPLDARSDVFSTGIVLHELLTGEKLFRGESEFALIECVQRAEIAPPSVSNRRVPSALDSVVMKALARDLAVRTLSSATLASELEALLVPYKFDARELRQLMHQLFRAEIADEEQISSSMLSGTGVDSLLEEDLSVEVDLDDRTIETAAGHRR